MSASNAVVGVHGDVVTVGTSTAMRTLPPIHVAATGSG